MTSGIVPAAGIGARLGTLDAIRLPEDGSRVGTPEPLAAIRALAQADQR